MHICSRFYIVNRKEENDLIIKKKRSKYVKIISKISNNRIWRL